ncbi:MAG: amidohydrolase 2 [Actinomycetia bacterium]|nr:amidohydrolase 2 [Actinomycetes bacterium]
MTAVASRIISADCHINEPPWVFDRVPDKFKATAPSEYCGTNVLVTSLDDYVGYDLIRTGWPQLADMVMYSTDYPHSLCLWPDTRDYVAKLMHGLTPEQKDKICFGNAARVYNI